MKTLKLVAIILLIAFLTQCILATTVAVHEDEQTRRQAIKSLSSISKSITSNTRESIQDSLEYSRQRREKYYENRARQDQFDTWGDPYGDQHFSEDY